MHLKVTNLQNRIHSLRTDFKLPCEAWVYT
jgi:hypothetical protein